MTENRPNKPQEAAKDGLNGPPATPPRPSGGVNGPESAETLRAEVERLRAVVAAVEALAKRWDRAHGSDSYNLGRERQAAVCADELEAVLASVPEPNGRTAGASSGDGTSVSEQSEPSATVRRGRAVADGQRMWMAPKSGGYSAKASGLPKPPPPKGPGVGRQQTASEQTWCTDCPHEDGAS